MVKMRKINKNDLDNIKKLINKYSLTEGYILENINSIMIMIENDTIIGLSIYKKISDSIGIITFTGYDMPFLTDEYKDGFFRATLNSILYNKMHIAIMPLGKDEKYFDAFKFKNNNILEYKKYLIKDKKYEKCYEIEIQEFFNRPCNG